MFTVFSSAFSSTERYELCNDRLLGYVRFLCHVAYVKYIFDIMGSGKRDEAYDRHDMKR